MERQVLINALATLGERLRHLSVRQRDLGMCLRSRLRGKNGAFHFKRQPEPQKVANIGDATQRTEGKRRFFRILRADIVPRSFARIDSLLIAQPL